MNARTFTSWILLAGVVLGVSCRKKESPKPIRAENTNTVAVVAGTAISTETLMVELKRRFRNPAESGLTAEQKLATLETLVRNEAVYAKAKQAGFDQSPELQARIKNLIVSQFKERQFPLTNAPVSGPEIEAFYQANAQRYAQPGAARGAVIFFSAPKGMAPENRTALVQRAEAVLSEARAAADDQAFAQLVARHSEDQATRYRGGDIGWVTRGAAGVDAALTEALLALAKPGEFAPLVQTARGLYIAKLVEKREAGARALGEVKEAIRYQISRQKAEQAERDFYAVMKEGLDIQINRAALDAVELSATAVARTQQPPALPAQ